MIFTKLIFLRTKIFGAKFSIKFKFNQIRLAKFFKKIRNFAKKFVKYENKFSHFFQKFCLLETPFATQINDRPYIFQTINPLY